MTERQKFILRAVLLYAQSNLDDLNDAFANAFGELNVNGDEGENIKENEVEKLLFDLQ